MALRTPTDPTRLERLAALTGALAVPFIAARWGLQPEAPPAKGVGAEAFRPEALLALISGTILVLGTVRSVVGDWRSRTWPPWPAK